jgi:hypothetical protein
MSNVIQFPGNSRRPAGPIAPLDYLFFAAGVLSENAHRRVVEYCLIASPERAVLQCEGEWTKRTANSPWEPTHSALTALELIQSAIVNRRVIAIELQPEDEALLPINVLDKAADLLRASRLLAHLGRKPSSTANLIADIKTFKAYIGAGKATARDTAIWVHALLVAALRIRYDFDY